MSQDPSKQKPPSSEGTAELSRGATALLAVAQENDKHRRIAQNTALAISLDFLGRLPALCLGRDRQEIGKLLGREGVPEKWFDFCVAFVDAIDSRIETACPKGKNEFSLRTDFDRSVFMALGQAIGEVARDKRKASLTLELTTEEVLRRLGERTPAQLQELLIKHYVGTLLQELFDSCKVRLTTRGLPRDTELNLREKDAEAIAKVLFTGRSTGASGVDVEQLLAALQSELAEIWQRDSVS
jgi:hypothetical protein